MTRVDFIFNVERKVDQAILVMQTQLKKGRQITVHVADEEEAAALDETLWTYDAASFLPHCMVTHDARYARHAERSVHLFDGKVVEERQLSAVS